MGGVVEQLKREVYVVELGMSTCQHWLNSIQPKVPNIGIHNKLPSIFNLIQDS